MAINKNAFIRYKTLDKCFSNPYKKYFINDLIEECSNRLSEHYGTPTSVSRRQIFMDIDFMKSDAGYQAPIESIKEGKKVYYQYNTTEYSIHNKPLTHDELILIENTLELISRIKGIPGIERLESVEAKLQTVNQITIKNKIIAFEENEFLEGLQFLPILFTHTKNQQVLNIKYKTFKSDELYNYIISPYYLKQYNKRWFLFGWNHIDNYLQNLALDRIVNINIKNQDFINTMINFEEYFEDIVGVTNFQENEVETIRILITNNIIPYIKSKPIHGSQKIKDNILTLHLKINYELESLILSFGEDMKVLEPKILADKIKNRIEKTNSLY